MTERTDQHVSTAREGRGEIDLRPEQTNGLQARHRLAASRAEHGMLQRIFGLDLLESPLGRGGGGGICSFWP